MRLLYPDAPRRNAGQHATIGLLLVNLGTPGAPTTVAVRRYLAEFLADPRVVEAPRWLWWPILHGFILRFRPRRSASAYAKVWSPRGSPLLAIARRQHQALQTLLDAHTDSRVRVALGMRYGEPTIASALDELAAAGVTRLVVLPLYPQYSATTTAATFDGVAQTLMRRRLLPELRFIMRYHEHPGYIAALADSVRAAWAAGGRAERLLLSFHGLPQRYADAGDPYPEECRTTSRLLIERLGLNRDEWGLSFQSRLGREPWLQPYTDQTLARWAAEGVRSVQVLCPGFAADCLETLEEIALANRTAFETASGGRLEYIAALNDRPDHIAALATLVESRITDWL